MAVSIALHGRLSCRRVDGPAGIDRVNLRGYSERSFLLEALVLGREDGDSHVEMK